MKLKRYRVVDEFATKLLHKAQKKLHLIPSPMLIVSIDTLNEEGDVKDRIQFKSNSFVRNVYNILAFQCGAARNPFGSGYMDGSLQLKAADGGLLNYAAEANVGNTGDSMFGRSSSDAYTGRSFLNGGVNGGVCVGTSNQAESLNDYNLIALIANGSAAGQLVYGGTSEIVGSWDATNRFIYATYSRAFSNSSGATITIKEIGLKGYMSGAYNSYGICLFARDVLPTPIDIPNGESRTITYTIKFPF